MQPSDTLRAGQKLKLTSAAPSGSRAKLASSTSSGSNRPVTYVVRKGDTLSAIARLFQVSAAQIASWNDLTSQSRIMPGQKLTIRVSSRRG
jgi:LysM repeat protein